MYVPVEPLAFRLLALLANGDPLAASCERVANESSDEGPTNLEEKVGPWFQAWASYGWVSQVVFPKLT
jgi:hypothetical protein